MPRKYFGRFTPKKEWFDVNNDGDVDYQDFLAAARNALDKITPSKKAFDINGDGVVNVNDALDAARITGATISGAGVTLAAGAVAGSVLVTGKASTIATVIASSVGGAIGMGLGVIFGTTTATAYTAIQFASGSWIVMAETIVSVSPAFITAMSTAGAVIGGAAKGVVDVIAGFPVIQTITVKSLESTSELLVIAGIPVAREVAFASGLVAVVIAGAYAYYVLTRNRISADEVRQAIDESQQPS